MEEERTEEQLNSTEVAEDSRGVEVPGSAQDERLGFPFPQIISGVGVLAGDGLWGLSGSSLRRDVSFQLSPKVGCGFRRSGFAPAVADAPGDSFISCGVTFVGLPRRGLLGTAAGGEWQLRRVVGKNGGKPGRKVFYIQILRAPCCNFLFFPGLCCTWGCTFT